LEGVYLLLVAEEWKKNGLAAIPEDQIQKIEGDYLLQEELKQILSQTPPRNNAINDILENMVAGKYNPKGPSWKRGRKTTSQHLQELDAIIINEGKVKALALNPTLYQ